MQSLVYSAQAYHPQLKNHSTSGTLRFDSLHLVFSSDEIELKLPLQGLQLRIGGSDDWLFFSHPNIERCEVCTKNQQILTEAALVNRPEIMAQIKKVRRKNLPLWSFLAVTTVLLILLSWGVMTGFSSLAKAVVDKIPPEWEKNLGAASFAQLQHEQTLLENPELEQQLQKLTRKLIDTISDSRYPFQIAIVKNQQVNAFALPGGYIVLNSGLITKAERGEEVLGVLAHEIAHVTRQHGLQNIVKSAGIYLTVQALFGDTGGLLQVLTDATPLLLTQKYSRDFEREADQVGLNYLVAAKINPDGMVSFFEKLQQTYKNTPLEKFDSSLNLLNTHPATEERIANLREQIAGIKVEQAQEVDKDFQALKQTVKRLSHE